MKKVLYALLIFMLGVFVALSGYAQPPTRVEKIQNELKNATVDTLKVELLNTLFDETVGANGIHAKEYAEKALFLAQKNQYNKGTVESMERLAMVYEKQKVFNKAQDFYNKALNLRQKANQPILVASLYNKLGLVAIWQKDYKQSLAHFRNAIDIYEERKDVVGICLTTTYMGEAYLQQKEYAKALTKYKEGFAIADSLKDHKLLAINLVGLGTTHFQQKQYKDAEVYFKQLLGISKNNNNNNQRISNLISAHEYLAEVAYAQGKYEDAYKHYREYVTYKERYVWIIVTEKTGEVIITQQKLDKIKEHEKQIEEQQKRIVWLLYAMVLGGLITFVILAFAVRSNLNTRKANRLLAEQQEEMRLRNYQLAEQKDKIEIQNDAINRKNALQEAAFQEIERKNKEITSSINYAKRIQESILPTEAKIHEKLPEHFIFFRPRDIVSGDFYWFTQRNGKIIIAALDCTGHGVPGAIMSMLGDSYLNQIIKLQGITEPQQILDSLHHNIGVALNQEETQNQDGMDIAICVIDPEKKTLEFAGASRPILIVQDGKMEVLESCKLPVGGFQRDRERVFEKRSFDLTKQTTFYVFSDGFQDQFGGTKGRKFAKNRLEELLFELHPKPMPEQKKLLNKTLVDWMGENRQMDDILIIGVKLHY